jgi:hypothetical protein
MFADAIGWVTRAQSIGLGCLPASAYLWVVGKLDELFSCKLQGEPSKMLDSDFFNYTVLFLYNL